MSKKIIIDRIFLFTFLFLFTLQNCATYWENRRKDFQDIFTLGVEDPGYGAGFRMSFLSIGFHFQGGETEAGKKDKGKGYGIRGGSLGKYHSQQLVFGFMGGESFYFGEPVVDEEGKLELQEGIPRVENDRDNLKSHKLRYLKFYRDPPSERRKRNKEKIRKKIIEDLIDSTGKEEEYAPYLPPEKQKPYGYPNSYLYQIEFFGGAYFALRAGFNIAEFFDFLLGFTTYDLLEDDLQ